MNLSLLIGKLKMRNFLQVQNIKLSLHQCNNVVQGNKVNFLNFVFASGPYNRNHQESPELLRWFLRCRQAGFELELGQVFNTSKKRIIQKCSLLRFVDSVCSALTPASNDTIGLPKAKHPFQWAGNLTNECYTCLNEMLKNKQVKSLIVD